MSSLTDDPLARIRVLLVDDHPLVRAGLYRILARTGDFRIVGEAATVAQALSLHAELRTDVVILDVRLPDGTGLDAVRKLREKSPSVGIVVVTMFAEDGDLFDALDAGASAFVSKSAPAADVVAAARQAAAAPLTFTAADLGGAVQRRLSSDGPRLTRREIQVLRLIAEGLSVAAIGRELSVGESTAKSHLGRLYKKLGATNRAEALMAGVRLRLIDPDRVLRRPRHRPVWAGPALRP